MSKLTQADRDAANIELSDDSEEQLSIIEAFSDAVIEQQDKQIQSLMDDNLLLVTMVARLAHAIADHLVEEGACYSLDELYTRLIVDAREDAQDVIDGNDTGDTYTLADLELGYYPDVADTTIVEPEDEDTTPILSMQDMLDWEDRHGE